MEISLVTVPPVPVLFFSTRTTIPQLSLYIGEIGRRLYAEAVRQHLLPVGPQQWIYYGLDGNPDTVFTLEIALPVDKVAAGNAGFLSRELTAFRCMSAVHRGCWENLSDTYGKIISAILDKGLKADNISRELYLNIDFKNPENAVTLVQVGVAD